MRRRRRTRREAEEKDRKQHPHAALASQSSRERGIVAERERGSVKGTCKATLLVIGHVHVFWDSRKPKMPLADEDGCYPETRLRPLVVEVEMKRGRRVRMQNEEKVAKKMKNSRVSQDK